MGAFTLWASAALDEGAHIAFERLRACRIARPPQHQFQSGFAKAVADGIAHQRQCHLVLFARRRKKSEHRIIEWQRRSRHRGDCHDGLNPRAGIHGNRRGATKIQAPAFWPNTSSFNEVEKYHFSNLR
jgi:hypothetical protein